MTEEKRLLGAATRMGIVLIYGTIAFLVAHLLGQTGPDRPGTGPAVTEATSEDKRLRFDLSASRQVEHWMVTVDGVKVMTGSVTEHRWSAEIDLAPLPDQRLVIDVTPSKSSGSPLAVRLKISFDGNAWEQTYWAPDDLVESVSLDTLWKAWEVTP